MVTFICLGVDFELGGELCLWIIEHNPPPLFEILFPAINHSSSACSFLNVLWGRNLEKTGLKSHLEVFPYKNV